VQQLGIGFARGVRQHTVAHEAAVDEEILGVGARLGRLRRAGEAEEPKSRALRLHRHAGVDELFAEQRGGAFGERLAAQVAAGAAVVPEREGDVAARQRGAAERLVAMAELGGFAAQELAARRRIEIEVLHRDAGSLRARRRLDLARRGAFGGDACTVRRVAPAARDRQARNRGNRGERLAAKAHARHAFQVLQAADLAGGVPGEGEREILARDALAVVLDLDAARAALVQRDRDGARARVEAVLHQLFQHRGRPLDHLAGGDLADEQLRQHADGVHAANGAARPRVTRSSSA
jgi:hypothetical protein